ncbi:MAG TPA: hypothetical protein VKV77_05945 [Methylovirgula sp.]|nr:hypothetical protein [Methylovirgula sp.]
MMDLVPPDWLQEPVAIEQADAQYAASGLAAEWRKLKEQMHPGDRLVQFESPRNSWIHLAGRAGIALVRDGKVIAAMVTLMN